MPSTRVTHKASLVNNTCVFGNSTGTGKQTGRNVLEMRSSFNGLVEELILIVTPLLIKLEINHALFN